MPSFPASELLDLAKKVSGPLHSSFSPILFGLGKVCSPTTVSKSLATAFQHRNLYLVILVEVTLGCVESFGVEL